MGKVTWSKDQRQKAKEFGLPLISVAIDGKHLPKDSAEFRGGMAIDGPATNSAMAQAVKELIVRFCKEANEEERKAVDLV